MDLSGLLGSFSLPNTQPATTGLLGQYYDPKEMQRQKRKMVLLNAGIALLSQQPRIGAPYSLGESLGTALRGGMEGAQSAQQDYMNNAQMAYQMNRQARQDARENTEFERKLKIWDDEDQRKQALKDFAAAAPEEQRKLAEMFPEQFAGVALQNAFPKPAEPYTLGEGQTRFDGNNKPIATGQQGAPKNEWSEVTLEDGVYAVNKSDPTKKVKIGPRADRNEGEGRAFSREKVLRESYIKEAKPFADLRTNYSRIKAAGMDNTGASDIAMVYSFMKMLDPTSVVREGEFATAENAGGVPQQIQSMYNRILDGQRLAPEVRADFMQQAERQYQAQFDTYKQIQKTYQGLAGQYQLDPLNVAPDLEYGVMPGSGSPINSPLKRTTRNGVQYEISP